MNKAQSIRARQVNPPLEPPRNDTYDADKNAKLFQEAQDISIRKGVQSYLVSCDGEPVCTIIFKITEARVTAIVTKFVNGRRVMWSGWANGYGYDKFTAAISSLTLVHNAEGEGVSRKIKLEDKHERWDTQLANHGFKVWRTL